MNVAIETERRQMESAVHHHDKRSYIRYFHDATTNAFSYVVHDPLTRQGAGGRPLPDPPAQAISF
ncbi:hypothetical protein [Sphingopyxis sp.]|uniref:hypothetical protein n=1 Tax=Sphingopyxis sp. TaxID=1908224 RepID=UPI0025CFF65F|nr:hypothetical protein [Sphingopyxis sp.]